MLKIALLPTPCNLPRNTICSASSYAGHQGDACGWTSYVTIAGKVFAQCNGAPSMGVRRTALFTFWDSGKRVDRILMIACPEDDLAARCATTKHTVSASLQIQPALTYLAPISVRPLAPNISGMCCKP